MRNNTHLPWGRHNTHIPRGRCVLSVTFVCRSRKRLFRTKNNQTERLLKQTPTDNSARKVLAMSATEPQGRHSLGTANHLPWVFPPKPQSSLWLFPPTPQSSLWPLQTSHLEPDTRRDFPPNTPKQPLALTDGASRSRRPSAKLFIATSLRALMANN